MVATPVDLIETYFDLEMDRKAIKALNRVPVGTWIDFAKQYQATMDSSFGSEFLTDELGADGCVRLYCEPILSESWDASVRHLYDAPSPLLGHGPDPDTEVDATVASLMLEPLKKHLLVADSVFIRDSFYYCFDRLADVASRDEPVEQSNDAAMFVARLKAWLPLLAELRPLITSRALVFTPYWLTPSFPYANYPITRMNELGLGMRRPTDAPRPPAHVDFKNFFARPDLPPQQDANDATGRVNEDSVILAWLNARLMGLGPVFPNRPMFDFASNLYLRSEEPDEPPRELSSDLISFDVLPLRREKAVSVKELMSLRKNEEGFAAVRSAVTECQHRLQNGLTDGATEEDAKSICGDIISEKLARHSGTVGRAVTFANDNVALSAILSVAVGAAVLPAAPLGVAFGLLVPTLFSPSIAKWAIGKKDAESRALARLQALL